MNPDEALRICRLAKALSPAQAVDDFTPDAWSVVLRGVRYVDAEQALQELGGEQEWIHVSHIVGRVKRIRRDRVIAFGTLPDPPAEIDPDGPNYRRWLATITEEIADGTYQRLEPAAIEGKRDVIRELGMAQSVDAALAVRDLREAHAEARKTLQAADAERKRERDEKRARREAAKAAERAARHPDPAQPGA